MDLGWRADGIARALAAGGVELELYRRPGFTGGTGVRRSGISGSGQGFTVDLPEEDDPYCDSHPRDRRRSTPPRR